MANNGSGLSTAGSTISAVSPALNAVPYVGSILSMLGTTVGGIMQQKGAQQQAEQAAKARKDALGLKTDAMRPEYLKKLQMDKMAALSDMAGIGFAKNQLEGQTANQLRAIRESSPSGSATVNAISAALGQRNADEQKLAIQNATYKQNALDKVSGDLEMLGNKGMALEERRDQWKREGLQAASALENAATANKMTAASTIIGGLTSGAASIGKAAQNQGYINALGGAYAGKTAAPAVDGTTVDLVQGEDGVYSDPTQGANAFADNDAKLNDLLSYSGELNFDDKKFLTEQLQKLAISGTQNDMALAAQIRSILNK